MLSVKPAAQAHLRDGGGVRLDIRVGHGAPTVDGLEDCLPRHQRVRLGRFNRRHYSLASFYHFA